MINQKYGLITIFGAAILRVSSVWLVNGCLWLTALVSFDISLVSLAESCLLDLSWASFRPLNSGKTFQRFQSLCTERKRHDEGREHFLQHRSVNRERLLCVGVSNRSIWTALLLFQQLGENLLCDCCCFDFKCSYGGISVMSRGSFWTGFVIVHICIKRRQLRRSRHLLGNLLDTFRGTLGSSDREEILSQNRNTLVGLYPIWPGNASGSAGMTWWTWMERGTSNLCCCFQHKELDELEKSGCGWFFDDDVALLDYTSLLKAFTHSYWRLKLFILEGVLLSVNLIQPWTLEPHRHSRPHVKNDAGLRLNLRLTVWLVQCQQRRFKPLFMLVSSGK